MHIPTHHPSRRARTVAVVAIGTAAALALSACGGSTSGGATPGATTDGASAAAPADPVDLRMTVWTADETQLGQFKEIGDAYVAAHPDLVKSVTFESIPFADYTTTLTTQLAGGNPPDLAWILESYAPEFVDSGALVDIKSVLEGTEGYEYDDLLPSSLSLWQQDDGLFAYPFSNSPFGMFVNTDQIAAAGQPNPADLVASGDWTYEKAAEIAAATAKSSGRQGLVVRDFDYKMWENLATVWDGWGASPWSEDGSTCTFTEPEMVDAMTWIHDQIFVNGAMPGPGTTADFFAGESAMTITQISRASALDDSFAWDLVPLPEGPTGYQSVIGQAGIGVLAKGKNPEIAAGFLAFFTEPENAAKLAAYFPPPRQSLLNAETLVAANPRLSEEQLQAVVIDGIDGAVTKPAHQNFAQLQQVVRAELDALWTPDASVDDVLAATCTAIDPLLAG